MPNSRPSCEVRITLYKNKLKTQTMKGKTKKKNQVKTS